MAIHQAGGNTSRWLAGALACVLHGAALGSEGVQGEIVASTAPVAAAPAHTAHTAHTAEAVEPEPMPEAGADPVAATSPHEGVGGAVELELAGVDREVVTPPPEVALPVHPVPPAPPVPTPAPPGQMWSAVNGMTLQSTVMAWARKADWAISWDEASPDLEVVGTVETRGTFIDAITYLFDVYHRSGATYDVTLFSEQKLVLVRNPK